MRCPTPSLTTCISPCFFPFPQQNPNSGSSHSSGTRGAAADIMRLLHFFLLLFGWSSSAFQPPSPPSRPSSSSSSSSSSSDRRAALASASAASASAAAALSLLLLQPVAPASASEAREAIAKAASRLPGYGPQDILYPPFFAGEWVLTREGAGLAVAPGEEGKKADPQDLAQARQWEAERLSYAVRFLPYVFEEGDGRVIADRGYNEAGLWRARAGGTGGGKSELFLDAITPRWDRSNPNVLTVSFPDGVVREVKVTKRSAESNAADTFGLTEFCRIAEAPQDTGVASIPRISAVRVLQRWKRTGPETIEGLELIKWYPPVSLTPDPPAMMTLKSRLRLERRR